MKAKKNGKSERESASAGGEDFFRLPRAEDLLDELRESPNRNIGDLVSNPALHLPDRFTLQVSDNRMEGADIREGDYVVVQQQPGYPEGCILAVQLGERQLVRRYFRAGGRIQLHCDPPSRQVLIVESHTPGFRILGQVVQVIREIK